MRRRPTLDRCGPHKNKIPIPRANWEAWWISTYQTANLHLKLLLKKSPKSSKRRFWWSRELIWMLVFDIMYRSDCNNLLGFEPTPPRRIDNIVNCRNNFLVYRIRPLCHHDIAWIDENLNVYFLLSASNGAEWKNPQICCGRDLLLAHACIAEDVGFGVWAW